MRLNAEHKFTGLRSSIFALCEAPEPNTFFSGDGNGYVCLWNYDEPNQAKALVSFSSQIFALRLVLKKQLLAIGTMSGQVFFYDFGAKKLHAIAHQINGAVFDFLEFDDHILIATEAGELVYLNQQLELVRKRQISKKSIRQMEWRSDDDFFLASSDHQIHHQSKGTTPYPAIIAHQNSVFCLNYLKNRQELWSGGRDAHLGIHKLAEEVDTEMISAHMYTINTLASTPNEEWMISGGRDKAIKLWAVEDRRLEQVIHPEKGVGHSHSVNCLLLDSSGKFLLSGSDDRSVMLWSLND